MTPRARISGLTAIEHDGGLLIRDAHSDAEHTLHPLTAFVWKHADGQTTVEELASRASEVLNSAVTVDHVWAAVDVLTGARLLEDRIAPPAGAQRVGRRDLLRTVAVGSAAAAALGVVATGVSAQSAKAGEAEKKLAQEEKEKAAELKARQEEAKKIQQRAEEEANKAEHAAAENNKKSQEQATKSQHEEDSKQAQEERGKNQNPFTNIVLDAEWLNIGDGFAPLAWERRGAHVHLVGMIEFAGTPEYAAPTELEPCLEPDPTVDPDHDEFDMETMLIGRLPEGARPPATLVFSVASDSILGASEVLITGAGEILLVLDDESDDQLDEALGQLVPPIDPNSETKTPQEPGGPKACARKALRRRRRLARLQRQRQRRLLRKRAQQARRRCIDGKEVLLTGPSEISFSGISFRVGKPTVSLPA